MATIPVYDQAQERAQALPGFRQESVASPALLGAPGENLQRFGEGVLAAGTGVSAVMYHMQEKENLQKLQEANATYNEQLQNWQIDAQKNKTGAAAEGLVDQFGEWHKKTVEEIGKGLGNDAQRQAFAITTRKTGLTARHDVATFQVAQTTKARDAAAKATNETLTGLGAAALTDAAAQQYKGELMLNTLAYAQSKNMTPVERDLAVLNATTAFHAQRIQQLARDNPDAAAEYFRTHEKEIAGDRRAEIGKFADQATAVSTGVGNARAIFTEVGPGGGLDVALQKAEEKYAKTPEVFKVVTAQLHSLYAAQKAGDQARTDTTAATVIRAVTAGASEAQIRAMPAFITLNTQMGEAGAKQAAGILEHKQAKTQAAINLAQSRESYAYTRELRQQQVLGRKADGAFWQYASDLDGLAQKTPDQIEVLRPTLGDAHTNKLHEMSLSLQHQAAAAGSLKFDMREFTALADKAGLHPNEPKQTEEQKSRLGRVYVEVRDRIDAATKMKGRPLDSTERTTELRKAFDDTVRKPGFWLWSDDQIVPVSALTDDERKKAVVIVPLTDKANGATTTIKINDIPRKFIIEAEAKERSLGQTPTQASTARLWHLNKDKWLAELKAR